MSNPATPTEDNVARSATPGENVEKETGKSTEDRTEDGQGEKLGDVSLNKDEYVQLLRDQARLRSLQKRSSTKKSVESDDGSDPELRKERSRAVELERQLALRDMRDGAREMLSDSRFSNIPESTRKLLMKAPHSLSQSDDVEGVLSDLEDYLLEESAALKAEEKARAGKNTSGPAPEVQAGTRQIDVMGEVEDVSKLTGTSRSVAVLRNLIRQNESK